ncbi:hypothetical protein BIY29_05225 [Brenneria alni]|uniref:Cellulose biosynthesis protein BcsR n=1 Tax=Brenneria alni TaxID=71656 RepID=A0A421DRE5_9GAMM|nr:cellulose biosynthesis protein BcsR [Brenneria alni]RLM26738.1 hypothetical protein BIY29_05225 [Brenneria alni]
MNDEFAHLHTPVSSEMRDDLHVLSLAFSLPEINYIDISRQTRLTQMMTRWPLLAELKEPTGSR